MLSDRRRVEIVLYGDGPSRRFLQETSVLPDVWTAFASDPGRPQSLLLQPYEDTPPAKMASEIRKLKSLTPIYNRTMAEVTATYDQLVKEIVPFTGWYSVAAGRAGKSRNAALRLPAPGQLWEDVLREASGERYPHPEFLALIRISGVLACQEQSAGDAIFSALEENRAIERNADWARRVLQCWTAKFGKGLPPPRGKLIYSISRNRTAVLAQKESIRTIKGDAAHALFSVKCNKLTWAIIDCGIDAAHPAFTDDPKVRLPKRASTTDRLKRSRVKETYDFSQLHEILLGDKLNDRQLAKLGGDAVDIANRISRGLPFDWGSLAPMLRIPHDRNYVPPTDGHGTHVAGILAANWDRDGDIHRGVCPDIRLIDLRVCRPDGTSSEFIVSSALQFVRYLNATADVMAVHGANMSLALAHEAANWGCGRTPVCLEADRTVATGVVVVVAAGNVGHRRLLDEVSHAYEQFLPVSITDPGNAESVITVGSTHRLEPYTYGVSYFSSRGPTGDGRIKPDLVAPGEKIFAPTLGEDGMRLDGTSMAAPHVSGAAAMLMARHVELIGRPQRVKQILCQTASDLGRERYFQGHGLVDILRAMQSV